MKLSVIIPVFNEEKTIKEIIKRVLSVKLPQKIGKEIIVIDDSSTDQTAHNIKEMKNSDLKYFRNEKNLGKGASVRKGIKEATGDLIIIQDADLEYNPDDYNKLLQPVLGNSSKVVYGTRFINYPFKLWGRGKTILPLHYIGNKFLTFLTNLLYGSELTDMETCYKLFRTDVLKKLDLKSSRFEIEPEMTIKVLKKGIVITEVPISVKPRTHQEGKKISWKDGLRALWVLIKYKFSNE